ncbi:MAG: hypothetical protein IPH57_00065 [Saprospiraceae bacterium]|nr:hypothetical protein [Saprospiraceae bacterium]
MAFWSPTVSGVFKRALKDLGFKINKLQGPPGKREILRAEKLTFNQLFNFAFPE